MNRFRTGLFALLLAATPVSAVEIEFTRHVSDHEQTALNEELNFFGVPGTARLIVEAESPLAMLITLNGEDVLNDGIDQGSTEIPVELAENNTISVSMVGDGTASVRIKQVGDVDLKVTGRIHFNTNVSNFEEARAFYGKLGFETLSGFPDTNTQAMARAIGIETPTSYDGSKGDHAGGYLLHGELIGPDGFWGGVIDLIEFTIPRNEEPPYPALNRLGMASAAMLTTDIDADYAYMIEQGVEFLSEPVTQSDGTRFAFFKDLDGTFYELVEVEGDREETENTHIFKMGHVGINVSDLERSIAWYRMFGYEPTKSLAQTESADVANAMGFAEPFEIRGSEVTLQVDESTLELVQWLKPFDPTPPFPVPINHLGIHRIALSTTDIAGDVAALKAQGVEFISPVTPCCSGDDSSSSIVAFYDPDGTIVELAEQPAWLGVVVRVISWFRNLF